MDTLAMMPLEIKATLVAALVVVLISAMVLLELRRAKQAFNIKLQNIAGSSESGRQAYDKRKCCLVSAWSLVLQFIFGIVAFALLACWSFFLFREGLVSTALFSALVAIIGIATPFYVWMSCKCKAKEMTRLISEMESRPATRIVQEKSPAVDAGQTVAASQAVQIKEPPVVAVKTAAPEPTRKAQTVENIPEDSMLRRHYNTHIASLQNAAPKPLAETAAITEIKKQPPPLHSCKQAGLPQDSMLKRHYLATLRSQIEAGLPPRPSDSMLKRHYDGWKSYLVEREIGKLCA